MIISGKSPIFVDDCPTTNLHFSRGFPSSLSTWIATLISSQVIEPESQLVVKVGGWLGQLQKSGFIGDIIHGSLNVPIEHHPTIRFH